MHFVLNEPFENQVRTLCAGTHLTPRWQRKIFRHRYDNPEIVSSEGL
jgi:hypothetical protein